MVRKYIFGVKEFSNTFGNAPSEPTTLAMTKKSGILTSLFPRCFYMMHQFKVAGRDCHRVKRSIAVLSVAKQPVVLPDRSYIVPHIVPGMPRAPTKSQRVASKTGRHLVRTDKFSVRQLLTFCYMRARVETWASMHLQIQRVFYRSHVVYPWKSLAARSDE